MEDCRNVDFPFNRPTSTSSSSLRKERVQVVAMTFGLISSTQPWRCGYSSALPYGHPSPPWLQVTLRSRGCLGLRLKGDWSRNDTPASASIHPSGGQSVLVKPVISYKHNGPGKMAKGLARSNHAPLGTKATTTTTTTKTTLKSRGLMFFCY